MADYFLRELKNSLDEAISELDSEKKFFTINPGSDFTRNRKITIPVICNSLIRMQSKSLPCEMLDFFEHSPDTPTTSAYIQQREKLRPDAFEFLLKTFNDKISDHADRLFRNYRLLAVDGSDVDIARNPDDGDTFIQEGKKGYNAIHVNAMFDLLNHTYTDILVQGKKKLHERAAFCTMADRCHSPDAIFIGDRGYESFNTFAHAIMNGHKFLIRMKDIHSNGILSSYDLPDGEFDMELKTVLTRRHTKETLNNPDTYTILQPYTDFDFIDRENPCFEINFRIVRFLTDSGQYICIATNLPDDFTADDIRMLYRLRWGEETSFRELKYTIGLVSFHSRKKELILQELYARVILYNFCELATKHAADTIKKKKGSKHTYRINFTTAVNICRKYLKSGGNENELMLLTQRYLTPIRDDRKYTISLRPKRNRDFMYRAA